MTRKNYHGFFMALFFILILLFFSKDISNGIIYGIRLSVLFVIPAVFPFLVVADYITSKRIEFPFEGLIAKAFSIPETAVGALVTGFICGFPSGAKALVKLYERNAISKKQLESLIGLVNNPSLAFIVSGVGIGVLSSAFDGVLLFVSLISALFITANVFISKQVSFSKTSDISRQRFDLVDSIKNAGLSSLLISSYIIFFSAVLVIFKKAKLPPIVYALIAAVFEIGNATSDVKLLCLNQYLKIFLCGFAIGFSGISVHLQSFSLLDKSVSAKKYVIMKFFVGVTTGVIASILKTLFEII